MHAQNLQHMWSSAADIQQHSSDNVDYRSEWDTSQLEVEPVWISSLDGKCQQYPALPKVLRDLALTS
jgi:hypothetical protein